MSINNANMQGMNMGNTGAISMGANSMNPNSAGMNTIGTNTMGTNSSLSPASMGPNSSLSPASMGPNSMGPTSKGMAGMSPTSMTTNSINSAMPYQAQPQQQALYQADPTLMQAMHASKKNLLDSAPNYMNRCVCVQMIDGQMFEGVVVHVDHHCMYLKVWSQPGSGYARPFFNPYNDASTILTLVLYELLVITLLL